MAKKKPAGTIQAPATPVDKRCVRFSFEFLDPDHPHFSLESCSKEFLVALLREILSYQDFTVDAFTQPDPKAHRHPIDFPSTSEPNGFTNVDPNREDLWTDSPWQFGLSDGKLARVAWRVHGFLSEETFYIVWLDPTHHLD